MALDIGDFLKEDKSRSDQLIQLQDIDIDLTAKK